jgi:phosphoribosylanthranilate isomerase
MAVSVKICGINSPEAMAAAVKGGAGLVGLNFYPPSPRFVSLDDAAALAKLAPKGVRRVGVFVDEPDEVIARTLDAVPLDMLQFHGNETPERVIEARARFDRPVIKAVKIAGTDDLNEARAHEDAADMLLFDAKPPLDMAGALPGGNALAFDWDIIAGQTWARPWMLSGGLDAANLAQAVDTSGAALVDVSSGVESAPGRKDPTLIRAFLDLANRL